MIPDTLDPKSLPYIYGYLEVTLGSARDLQPDDFRNRIKYVLSVMRGEPDPSYVANEPPIPGLEESLEGLDDAEI